MSLDLVLQGPAAGVKNATTILQTAFDGLTAITRSGFARLRKVPASAEFRAFVDGACQTERVDYGFMQPGARLADYGLVVMDMDSTLITIECIDEIADMVGIKPQVAAITEATMRGEIKNFEESLRRRVALLKGLDFGALQRVYDERLQPSPGAETMLAAVRAAGLKTLLVSGGFTFFTERLKSRLQLDFAHANTLETADGKLTGNVLGKVVDADEKARLVQVTCAQLGIPTSRAIVMGDGANDLTMMKLAGISVAFHAKPVVRAQATHAINFGGLDVMPGWFAD